MFAVLGEVDTRHGIKGLKRTILFPKLCGTWVALGYGMIATISWISRTRSYLACVDKHLDPSRSKDVKEVSFGKLPVEPSLAISII